MWEYFSVIDANHDDPTLFPTLSGLESTLPFERERTDGGRPGGFRTSKVAISQYTGASWTKTRSFSDLKFEVVITEGRVVVYCEKFTKGGGWWGFGAGGLAVALVANAVSHARAANRRKGRLLVAQVRYPWLLQVGAAVDKRGRPAALRLIVNAGSAVEDRLLALDLTTPPRLDAASFAANIAQLAARSRLNAGPPVPEAEASRWQQLATNPAPHAVRMFWAMPSAIKVGQRGSIPTAASPAVIEGPKPPVIEAPKAPAIVSGPTVPELPAIPAQPRVVASQPPGGWQFTPPSAEPAEPASVTPTLCPMCSHPSRAGAGSCSRCGYPYPFRPEKLGNA